MKDNLVNFPEKDGPHTEPVDEELNALRNAQNILKSVTEKRKKAVDKLSDVVDSLDNSEKLNVEHMSPGSVEVLRDLRRGLSEALTALEAHDNLLDMVTNDMVSIVGNFEAHADTTQKTGIVLQSLIIMLMDKGLMTAEDFKQAQIKVISELQKLGQKK